ncbi:hypothetical protein [Thermocoleostomius sinensis]|uniref:Uncharacterized protein n=1 Tax=Thermocoleostomius sinensis A174 TaxID=2016057 RepID=A0A9E9C8Y0_9CYAN|nr:hypothetical protein [Thermocoleostomius sinensis]WAL60783.1 hypothetical protein OXH18_01955 [Thermocoleostomius sinensis A174]
MSHTFLLEPGKWMLQGNWLDQDALPVTVKGKILVAWNRNDWFTMITKLIFPQSDRAEISWQYRGRLNTDNRQYTFVLQHSLLGRVEGEGWVAPESIVQRYWVLSDRQRRTGFETLHQLSADRYCLSSSLMAGHHLMSLMEATIERLSS